MAAQDTPSGCRSGSGPAVAVRGVQLDVDLALTQTGARTLASGRAGTPSKDNRNLYLVSALLLTLLRYTVLLPNACEATASTRVVTDRFALPEQMNGGACMHRDYHIVEHLL